MGSTLAFVPFRVVHVPTTWVGYAVAWLAEGYRTASPLERALIFPTWAVLRCVFVVGFGLALLLHTGGRRLVGE
jgi:hypothetical protein